MVVMTVGDLRHSLIFRGSSRTVAGAGRHHLNIHILINLFIIIVAATRNLAVPDEQVKYFLVSHGTQGVDLLRSPVQNETRGLNPLPGWLKFAHASSQWPRSSKHFVGAT